MMIDGVSQLSQLSSVQSIHYNDNNNDNNNNIGGAYLEALEQAGELRRVQQRAVDRHVELPVLGEGVEEAPVPAGWMVSSINHQSISQCMRPIIIIIMIIII